MEKATVPVDLISYIDAGKILKRHPNHISRYTREGVLIRYKILNKALVSKKEVENLLIPRQVTQLHE